MTKDTNKYCTTFDGDEAENTRWEYMVETKVIAENCKWMTSLETNVVKPTTKEQRAGEASGKHWFVMTCKGDALLYVHIHHEKGSVYNIWSELKQRYDGVAHNDLQDLYEKINDVIEEGPNNRDPLLWFTEIERNNEAAEKGGGRLKDDAEILVLIKKPMQVSKHYTDCATALKLAADGKKMDYESVKDFYRNHWFESIKPNKSEQNKTFFVKKYGYKYFSGNCRICGQQGHKAADCTDKKQAPAQAWKPNGAMN
jgi:hypothetical protein